MNYVSVAIPYFILLIGVEFLWGQFRGRQTYRLNDTVNSLSMGLMSSIMNLLRLGFAGVVFSTLVGWFGVTPLPADSWWVIIPAFIAYDFLYYWKHRMGHEWRIMWASHVAHHQSEEFNLSTALRQTGTDYIGFVFYIPLYLAGVPVEVVVTVGSLNLVYQFWVHTEHVRRVGPLEWILVTPSNHRVHHAKNPRYIDRNYGGFFIIWDRLFGTFQDELDEEPCYYGITHALQSWNPVWANLHIWVETFKLSLKTKHWKDKFIVWFKPPSWQPDDLPAEHFDWQAPKFDPAISRFTRIYAFTQYWIMTAVGLTVSGLDASNPRSFSLAAFVLLVWGLFAMGRLLETRADAIMIEWSRLVACSFFAIGCWWYWPMPAWVAQGLWLYTGICAIALLLGTRLPSLTRESHSHGLGSVHA